MKPLSVSSLLALGAGRRATAMASSFDETDPVGTWVKISKGLLEPSDSFELHWALYEAVYDDWDQHKGPPPAWMPPQKEKPNGFAEIVGKRSFKEAQAWSVNSPEAYWSAILKQLGVVFAKAPSRVLTADTDLTRPRWLPGAHLNIAESCFVGRDPDGLAMVWKSAQGAIQRLTVRQLHQRCCQVARSLDKAGFSPGDPIAIDMPMTASSVFIYLGVILFGGVVVSIADSFAADQIATRLKVSGAVGIFTQDVIIRGSKRLPLYSRVVEARAPRAIVLSAEEELSVTLREGDVSWRNFLCVSTAEYSPHIDDANSTTNILFSSGTTGSPKAIPWTHITPIKAAGDAFAHHEIGSHDVVAWPTNLGWMMGPWLIYASLLNGAAIAIYEGSPLQRGFVEFVRDAGVSMLGVVPSLVKAWRASGVTDGIDWSCIRRFSSTGEPSNPEDTVWLMSRAGYQPVIEYCGGTEIGGGYITGSMRQPQSASTFSTPAMGSSFFLLGEDGNPGENGELALISPMLGSSDRLLNLDHDDVYFKGMPEGPQGEVLRRHGDQLQHVGGGYYRALGRVDDTMNLGGIKISAAEIERVCQRVAGVHEAAAIAVTPQGGGPSELVVVVVTDEAHNNTQVFLKEMQSEIRTRLNPLFKIDRIAIVDKLPRTASNKVMRRVLRQQLR